MHDVANQEILHNKHPSLHNLTYIHLEWKIAPDAISEHVDFKIFVGGMPPDPPSISMLRMLSCLLRLVI